MAPTQSTPVFAMVQGSRVHARITTLSLQVHACCMWYLRLNLLCMLRRVSVVCLVGQRGAKSSQEVQRFVPHCSCWHRGLHCTPPWRPAAPASRAGGMLRSGHAAGPANPALHVVAEVLMESEPPLALSSRVSRGSTKEPALQTQQSITSFQQPRPTFAYSIILQCI